MENPPPPKAIDIIPPLDWRRTIKWWPKCNWGGYDTVTFGNDLSPADKGYKLWEIQDLALIYDDGAGEDEFPITSIEVTYSPHDGEDPQECGYVLIHKSDTPDEEVVFEDGFKTIDDARQAATQAFAAILKRTTDFTDRPDRRWHEGRLDE